MRVNAHEKFLCWFFSFLLFLALTLCIEEGECMPVCVLSHWCCNLFFLYSLLMCTGVRWYFLSSSIIIFFQKFLCLCHLFFVFHSIWLLLLLLYFNENARWWTTLLFINSLNFRCCWLSLQTKQRQRERNSPMKECAYNKHDIIERFYT